MLKLISCSVTSKTYLKGAMISPHGLLSFRYTQYTLKVCTYYLNPPTHPVQLSTILGHPPTLPKGVRNMYTAPWPKKIKWSVDEPKIFG